MEPIVLEMGARAEAAAQDAYCPYSGFRVGAAVLTGHGTIFSGCNVENASYGLTTCAERVAVFRAVAAGHCQIRKVVIYTDTLEGVMPCGACRQVIHEFGPDAVVYSRGTSPTWKIRTMGDLLPDAFGPEDLEPPVAEGPGPSR